MRNQLANEINKSSSCKDLGIIFTNILTWREHYEMISAKAYKSLGLLRRVFKTSHSPQVRKEISLYLTAWLEPNYSTVLLYGSLIY